ncbi:MAG: hypothetical protein ABIN36_09260 [Ferruginibacter sp.]
MKAFIIVISILLSFKCNSQSFDNVSSMQIKHVAIRCDHYIPTLFIDYQSEEGKKKESTRVDSDTANFVNTNKKDFKILLDYLYQESLVYKPKSDTVSKFGETQISFYRDKKMVFLFSILGKLDSFNYLNKVLDYAILNALGSDIITFLEYFISDIENHK